MLLCAMMMQLHQQVIFFRWRRLDASDQNALGSPIRAEQVWIKLPRATKEIER
jgi:hypothetical protein